MLKKIFSDLILWILAILFSMALMFAFIELPRLIDKILQDRVGFPGFDHGMDEFNLYKAELYITALHLRWIGYSCLALIFIFILLGFVTRRSGWAWVGALALFLPVFGQFALSMFFLAGLGILRIGWMPLMDISLKVLELGNVIYIPYWILMWFFRLFNWYAHQFLSYFFMVIGEILFVWGVMVWLKTRFRDQHMATQWIYRFSRHPQYLGWIIWSYGFMLFSSGINQMKKTWEVPSSLPWLLATMVIIGICMLEEIQMKKLQGEKYESYRKNTPFLFPLPRWIKWLLKIPMRLIIRKDRPGKKQEVAWVIMLYTGILILLSIIWIDLKTDKPRTSEVLMSNVQHKIDSLIIEIRKPQHRRDLYRHFEKLMGMGEESVDPLTILLSDINKDIREFAAYALGEMKAVDAVNDLIRALNDSIPRVRNTAAESLGRIGSEEAVEPLVSLLKYPVDAGLRHNIYRALGESGLENSWPVLVNGLNDSIWYCRIEALNALNKINHVKSRDYIIHALEDNEIPVRRNAVFIILQKPSEEFAEYLQKAINDEDFETRFYAKQALKLIE